MVTMNLVTLEHLLSENRRDFLLVASRHATPERRHRIWRRMGRRRCKAVRLVEELDMRANLVRPWVNALAAIAASMRRLKSEIQQADARGANGEASDARRQLHQLMRLTGDSCFTLTAPHGTHRVLADTSR